MIKKTKKVLLNISNHPSTTWTAPQREGWDEIIDIEFPYVKPEDTVEDIIKLADKYMLIVSDKINEHKDAQVYVHLSGEYTFCYKLYDRLKRMNIPIAISTSERKVVTQIDSEGRTIAKRIYKFAGWRFI